MKFLEKIKGSALTDVLIILVLSLVPLIWFKSGYLITGVDVDFHLFPLERWEQRTHVWLSQVMGGTDQSNNTASLFVILLQTLLASFGFLKVITIEKITFVFWNFAVGLSMYFFLRVLIPSREAYARVAVFAGVMAYLFNMYNAFIWVRLQMALPVLVLFPVYFGLIILVTEKRIRLITGFICALLLSMACGAIGIQPPLVFIFFISVVLFLLFYWAKALLNRNVREGIDAFKAFFWLGLAFLLGSLYWLLPLMSFATSSGYGDKATGISVYSVNSLIAWVSSVTGFLNVFRLLGEAPWFDGFGGQPYAPDFEPYIHNVFIIALSFVLPFLILLSFFFFRRISSIMRKDLFLFFATLTLVSLFFAKGSHAPLGGFYTWMVDHFPFFWLQRAPWQKFTLVTVLGYSVLAGVALGLLYEYLSGFFVKSRQLFKYGFWGVLLIYFLGYNFYYTTGAMFPTKEGDYGFHQKFDLGYHQQFPDHLFLAREWINDQRDFHRIALFPNQRANVYRWGFGSAGDVSLFLLNKGILFQQYGEGYAPPNFAENVYQVAVRNIYESVSKNAYRLFQLLNIKYVLQRNDIDYDFYGATDSPEFIKERMALQNKIKKVISFGEWDFYKVDDFFPALYVPRNIYMVADDKAEEAYSQLFNPDLFDDENASFALYTRPLSNVLPAENIGAIRLRLDRDSTSVAENDEFEWKSDNRKFLMSAVFYPGSKRLIHDDGRDDPGAIVFPSPAFIPYRFQNGSTVWDANDSTIVYIQTGKDPVQLNDLTADGSSLVSNVVGVFSKSDARGPTGIPVRFPLYLPAHENVMIQINTKVADSIGYTLFRSIDVPSLQEKNSVNCRPTVEYKRINSVRYKVNFHGACRDFPFILSENYHSGWKVYLDSPLDPLEYPGDVFLQQNYSILKGNEVDQATLKELSGSIKNGWISSLGNGEMKTLIHKKWHDWKEVDDASETYVIDFISKNNHGTIQNDNLENGHALSTLFHEPLFTREENLVANGFANSWIMNLETIKKTGRYTPNDDGTLDFSVTIEFWPQRLLYVGFFIGMVSLFGALLLFCFMPKHRMRTY